MSDELIGKVINGYEILDRIGEGGMATVYMARQQSMNRSVALKMLPRQYLKDDTYLQRFEREVKIVSQLEHRNIVPVYNYGEYEGQPYIAMRYMPAGSVDDLLQKGPLSPERILDILQQIAPALDYAHSKDVLHRDLKPSNVLMDDGGGAFITDFGIARVLGEQGTGITTQGVVGTPAYMSPEQAQGKDMDGRSDVYSLGIMLFEMATGRRPFESETPYSIAVMQVTTPPPSPCKLNPMLSSALETVILKSLRKSRSERYESASQLVESLQMAIENPGSLQDTSPGKAIPEARQPTNSPSAAAKPPSSQQNQAAGTPPPQQRPVYPHTPSPSSSASRVSRPAHPGESHGLRSQIRRKRKENPLLSALVGGAIGCGLLGLVAALGFFALSFFLPLDNATPSRQNNRTPATTMSRNVDGISTVTAVATASDASDTADNRTATLDLTSEQARQNLLGLEADNDATATAVREATAAAPTQAPGIDPIGVRGTPQLLPALNGVSGIVVFADIRGDERRTLEVVTLNLDTWTETQLTQEENANNSYPAASPDGRWIAFQSDRDGDTEIFIMNPVGGQRQQMTFNTSSDRLPAWSPDGNWILYSAEVNDGQYDIRRVALDGSADELVYSNGQRNSHPRYSPDGRYLLFTTGANPQDARTWEIARLDTDTAELVLLTDNDTRDASAVFSPDGETILYISSDADGDQAITTMTLDGKDKRVLYDTSGLDWAASYSPAGDYIVFTSNADGADQLYLMTASGGSPQQITSGGGLYASWIP